MGNFQHDQTHLPKPELNAISYAHKMKLIYIMKEDKQDVDIYG